MGNRKIWHVGKKMTLETPQEPEEEWSIATAVVSECQAEVPVYTFCSKDHHYSECLKKKGSRKPAFSPESRFLWEKEEIGDANLIRSVERASTDE